MHLIPIVRRPFKKGPWSKSCVNSLRCQPLNTTMRSARTASDILTFNHCFNLINKDAATMNADRNQVGHTCTTSVAMDVFGLHCLVQMVDMF